MVKILITGLNRTIGGIERMILSYVQHIDRSKIAFEFINIHHDTICFQDEFEKLGCIVRKLPNYKVKPVSYFFQLFKLLWHERYDIIHVNMVSAANILSLIAAKVCGCKTVIAHSHNSDLPSSGIRRFFHRFNKPFLKLFATEYFACSKKAGDFLFGQDCKYTIIRNAIDVSLFVFSEDAWRSIRYTLGISESVLLIGHIGRFVEQKNHIFLLHIFKSLLSKREDVVLLLIGEGCLEQKIRKTAEDLSILDKIIFYGTTDRIQDLYSAMDIFVFPSLYEGLPLAGIEAQASGLPIVAANVISKEMKITQLVTWLDLKDSPETWAEAAIAALTCRSSRKNMAVHITNAGYNITHESKILEEKYLALVLV
jgi:glycosyltransferase involved in cell wall biosynthesis